MLIHLLLINSSTANAQGALEPVFVFSGGYGSCNDSIGPTPGPDLLYQLHQNIAGRLGRWPAEIPLVVTCYRSLDLVSSSLEFALSPPPGPMPLADHISRLLATKQRPALIFMGHSWGGSLAAQNIVQVRNILNYWAQDPRYINLRDVPALLVTIDSIDINLCHQPLLSVIGNPDCLNTPRLFDPSGGLYPELMRSVNGWLNIYQTQGILLHGGPINSFSGFPNKSGNLMLGGFGLSAHTEIREDQRTWSAIMHWVSAFLQVP